MQVNELMTRDVCVCTPEDSLRDCAAAMARNDVGALPVAENNMLIGMVSDRDIAVRGIGAGLDPETPVREVLSREVLYCYEDQDLEPVARGMGTAKVRRVPVLTRERRVAGILSLGDVARREPQLAAAAVAELSRHGGPHSQAEGPHAQAGTRAS